MSNVTKRGVAQILRSAANKIAKGGLAKGTFKDGQSYCALGALGFGWANYVPSASPQCKARDVLARNIGVTAIPPWNDKPERTANEVVGYMRRTARALEHGMSL